MAADNEFDVFQLPKNWVYDPETKYYTSLATGDIFCAGDKLFCFIDKAPIQTVSNDCHAQLEKGDKSCAKVKPFNFADHAFAATETVPKQVSNDKAPPLRLYAGNGPAIHRQLSIVNGVADKRCQDCGRVGQLTCFSHSFRNWALRRATEKELNQICSRCKKRGHNCLNCDIPITYRSVQPPGPVFGGRKTVRCGLCGETGHTRRSCFRAV